MQNYSNSNFLDPVGEKHNTWRTSRIPTLLVVVRNYVYISLTVTCPWFFSCAIVCFMIHLVHSVFWDLYCAAPERRETCDHSSEAKAFHDYVSRAFMVNSYSDFVSVLSCPRKDKNCSIKVKKLCK